MDRLKKRRTVLRSAFTRVAHQLESILNEEEIDFVEADAISEVLQQKVDALKIVNDQVFDEMMAEDASEDELNAEMNGCDEYLLRFARLQRLCNKKRDIKTSKVNGEVSDVSAGSQITVGASEVGHNVGNSTMYQRKFKLPKIELVKFGGDVREWLSFWSQFKKIHEAADLAWEDKFQYLQSVITPGTRARDVVDSFPPTAENYDKVIDSLKSRYGRDDLLVEVYVRELLKLILTNAMTTSNRSKSEISTLYDKLETQLRALETLGVNTDTCSAMLYPLVESCLPEELLRVWQRSTTFSDGKDATLRNRLGQLMNFMKREVESSERISFALEGFALESSKLKKSRPRVTEHEIPTAAGLLNNVSVKCCFCDGSHRSEKCFKAQKLTLEEKRKVLRKKRACFLCANTGHSYKSCRESLTCIICGGQHIAFLCPNLTVTTNNNNNQQSRSEKSIEKGRVISPSESCLSNRTEARVFLQTLIVKLRSDDGEKRVRAIIDTGSQRSYVSQRVVHELRYRPQRTESIIHSLFGGNQTEEQKHSCYDIRLKSIDGKYACRFEALDQPVICGNIPSVYPGIWTKELKRANIRLTDTNKEYEPIDVLIGADVAGQIMTGRKRTLPCGLVALETLLGWVLMGKIPVSINHNSASSTMVVTNMLSKNASISALWELEILGITDPGEKRSKAEHEMAVKRFFEETVVVNEEGRYEVKLPWLEGHASLSSNYTLAKKRLEHTEKKLLNSKYWERYDQVFTEWLQEEIIEEVPSQELNSPAHYLPHRPVIKESSATTKIRPVFDASAKEKGKPSLNDCLEKGVNLIERIPDILLRFRKERIGVTSDIRKAFLQISLNKQDRDFLRFIWKTVEGNDRVFRHRRVVFGINASPFLLGATIEYHLKKCLRTNVGNYCKETIEVLLESFYVDNCVNSVTDTQALEKFISEATKVMADAKFDLRGWEYTGKNDDVHNMIVPVLGLSWNKTADTLALSSVPENSPEKITKRVILSFAQRIFDPIGFSSPVTICPKILLQEMWQENIGWDVELVQEKRERFEKWKASLHFLSEIEIPRCVYLKEAEDKSLHVFCDASKVAYAAAVFLRVVVKGTVRIFLLQARARIAPIKKLTIPRLELMAATIGARLGSQIKDALNSDVEIFYWSDATTVLSWIRRTEDWAVFVANRVQEIRCLTSIDNWRYVPGELNPADLPSRGCSAKTLVESKWWEGPEWLYEHTTEWPQKDLVYNQEEIESEKKKKIITAMLNINNFHDFYKYFSSYRQNVRCVGWIYRFVYNCKNKENLRRSELSDEEWVQAEKKLIWIIQQESFSSKDTRLATLNVFWDEENLLRLETKISQRKDIQSFCHPYILPGQHTVVKRLIHDTHVDANHVGVQGLLIILRERYWIMGGRRVIRSVLSTCIKCKRYAVKHFEVNTPTLPVDRVREAACFEVTGVDFAGPLYLRDRKKAWICLYTCAVYRAVHLELITTLSTSGFIQALRRFIARRGRPQVLYSDNGSSFVGTDNIFRHLDWQEIQKYTTERRIHWNFNPPSAPWWGGWWERLIGLLKQLLRRVLGRAHLNGEELYTVLCDCEAVLNSRPLTYVSNDPSDLEPLTPSMFLRELRGSGVPDCDVADTLALNKRFRYLQRLREELRKRFRVEYLGLLRQVVNKRETRSVSENEIVLIGNVSSKRLDWPLGRVIELVKGKDNKVRLVRVQTQYGQVLRPIQHIYPLECPVPAVGSQREGSSQGGSAASSAVNQKQQQSRDVNSCGPQSAKVSRYGRKLKPVDRF